MKERGIIFSGEMVKAILDGRKTSTRRIVKPQPPTVEEIKQLSGSDYGWFREPKNDGYPFRPVGPVWAVRQINERMANEGINCPFGTVGDRLWVRETLKRNTKTNEWEYADGEVVSLFENDPRTGAMIGWAHHKDGDVCSSIHMPRWASRITLEITGVRVERVQDISQADVIEEGVEIPVRKSETPGKVIPYIRITGKCDPPYKWPEKPVESDYYRHEFAFLWDEINGAGSWTANPWVWVISFKRLESKEIAA